MVINKRFVIPAISSVLGACLICAGVGYGIINYTEKEVAAALAAQETEYKTVLFENTPADEVLPSNYWTDDGYEDFVSWWTALKELRDSAEGMTTAAIEGYDYLTEEHQAQLLEIENQMIFAMSIKEWTELKNEFDKIIEDAKPAPKPAKQQTSTSTPAKSSGSSEQASEPANNSGSYNLRRDGIVNWGGYRFTWYSERRLPGGGLNIPGRHVNGAGFVCDGDGYICAATAMGYGTTGDSPWGAWKSYDTGVSGNTVDMYVNW